MAHHGAAGLQYLPKAEKTGTARQCQRIGRRRPADAFVCPHGLIQQPPRYLMSVSILNIGRYIEITIVPTMIPTPIIRIGSMMDVSDWMLESTSSS